MKGGDSDKSRTAAVRLAVAMVVAIPLSPTAMDGGTAFAQEIELPPSRTNIRDLVRLCARERNINIRESDVMHKFRLGRCLGYVQAIVEDLESRGELNGCSIESGVIHALTSIEKRQTEPPENGSALHAISTMLQHYCPRGK